MKNHNILKFALCCICAVIALLLSAVPAFAAGGHAVEFGRKGSITIGLHAQEDNVPISGAELSLYQAGELYYDDGDLAVRTCGAFASSGISLTDIQKEGLASELAEYAAKHNVEKTAVKTTDTQGKTSFEALPVGLYVVVQTKAAGGFALCEPFLVLLPMNEDGAWLYDINAEPKTDITRTMDITVKKVWNDSPKDASRPASVKIQLLNGDTVKDTVVLNAGNNWTYTWTGLEKSDRWSVREIDVPKGYTATYSNQQYTFTVTNTSTLVQTGQLNWPIPVLAGCGVLLFAAGWYLVCVKGKKERE